MKLAFKHKVVLPDVERVLRDAARVDSGFLRFPRPIDEIITLCYPLAIQEVVGLDSRKARAEIAKLGGPAYEESGENQKLAGFLFTRSDGGVVLIPDRIRYQKKQVDLDGKPIANQLPR